VQNCFSKLRSSIAGLYAWRAEHSKDEDEQDRMRKAADLAFRQAFVLCPYSPEVVFRYSQLLLSRKRIDEAILVAETAQRFDPDNASFKQLVRSLHQAE
jgi:predicted Zn-dependent protease